MKGGWNLDKRLPVGFLAGLLIQTAGVIWWASKLSAVSAANSTEILRIQARQDRMEANITGTYERLARIEANQDNQLALMQEIRQSLVRR
ncbi:MAG: hypothetical protein IKE42_28260 [Aquamicrobium sp.]|nr:hypothetical protein [Aquamicrobium sp.]